jgi:hypothetical protein
MLQDYKPMADIAIGVLLWVMIIANVVWCARRAQASDKQRAAQEVEVEMEAEAEEEPEPEDEPEDEDDGMQEHIELLESQIKVLREEKRVMKAELEVLKKRKGPRKVIGMKILGGFRGALGRGGSLEDNVHQALTEGWEISGAPMHAADTTASWYQTMLRYETGEEVAQPKAEAAPAPAPAPTQDFSSMLNAEEVAEKIRALPKGEWQTSYDIQKALAPAAPHKTPFAPIKTINSVLYSMLGKGEAVKAVTNAYARPIWKLV